MKIIEVHNSGYERMVCESVGYFYGSLIVRLLNGHSVKKNKGIAFRLETMEYELKQEGY